MHVNWTPDLAVGVSIIDEQHQEYFRRLNRFLEVVDLEKGKIEVAYALGFVRDYAEFHFDTEEEYMAKRNYPEYVPHAAQHAFFKRELESLANEFDIAGTSSSLVERTRDLLVDWLVNHIKQVDVQLGAFLKKEGMGA